MKVSLAGEFMSEDDDERVEYRLSTTGKLVSATQERIDELMRLRSDREKLSRPRPAVGFDAVLATTQSTGAAPDPDAESLARSKARQERAQAMARAGLQPIKADSVPKRGAGVLPRAGTVAEKGGADRAAVRRSSADIAAESRSSETNISRFTPAPPRVLVPEKRGTNPGVNPDALPPTPPAREVTVIRAAPVPKSEPTKAPPPKAPPRAGKSRRTIIKG